jgi:hypothetical protein
MKQYKRFSTKRVLYNLFDGHFSDYSQEGALIIPIIVGLCFIFGGICMIYLSLPDFGPAFFGAIYCAIGLIMVITSSIDAYKN